jgi:hypothetical protein
MSCDLPRRPSGGLNQSIGMQDWCFARTISTGSEMHSNGSEPSLTDRIPLDDTLAPRELRGQFTHPTGQLPSK